MSGPSSRPTSQPCDDRHAGRDHARPSSEAEDHNDGQRYTTRSLIAAAPPRRAEDHNLGAAARNWDRGGPSSEAEDRNVDKDGSLARDDPSGPSSRAEDCNTEQTPDYTVNRSMARPTLPESRQT